MFAILQLHLCVLKLCKCRQLAVAMLCVKDRFSRIQAIEQSMLNIHFSFCVGRGRGLNQTYSFTWFQLP